MRLAGVIRRRLLVNWRVDASGVAPMLPPGLRPQVVDGSAVAGICVLEVTDVRPTDVPLPDPVSVVSAAYRVAVQWDESDGPRTGVFVAARHTRSPFAAMLGGRLLPGVQRLAHIDWRRGGDESVSLRGRRASAHIELAETNDAVSGLFGDDLAVAADFFGNGDVAWSLDRARHPEPLRMRTLEQRFEPLAVRRASSSWIDSLGADASLDSAFVMRDVRVEWDRPRIPLVESAPTRR